MKKKFCKKARAGIMVAALMVGMLQTGIRPMTVHAETTIKTMNLDTSCLAPSNNKWDKTNDHKVYFGQYNGNPTAFRVLKADGSTMMLDCDTILLAKAFNSNFDNKWDNSDMKGWLNGDGYYGNPSVFTSAEKSVIAQTELSEVSTGYRINGITFIDYAAKDYVYLLSAKEVNEIYADDGAREKTGGISAYWWLRSAKANEIDNVGIVNTYGSITALRVDYYKNGVSPAFNLDLSSVLFTSAISEEGVNKSSEGLTQVTEDDTTKEWKLTLLDKSKNVKVTDGERVTQSGNIITVPYTYEGSDVNQISVMITDGPYDTSGTAILYYGKLDTTLSSSSGGGTFTLPEELPDGYRMYILAEKVNEGKLTDYASAPAEITVAEIVETPTADLTGDTYSENQSVTFSSATDGASIYYTMTTDGTEPADPATAGTLCTDAISLKGTEGSSVTYKIKAIAVKTGMVNSSAASFEYTISIPATTYKVTVVNGIGGGYYAARTTVTITADTAEAGQQFREWTGADELTFVEETDKTSATAKFTMPANVVTVTAVYEDIPVVDITAAPSITTQPQSVSVKEGETAVLRIAAAGTEPLSYQWMINRNDENGWVNIINADAESYTISVVDMDCNEFQYKCVVSNAEGSAESNVVILTVTQISTESTEYHIVEGADQSIAENYDGTIIMKADGEFSRFVSVSVDGTVVDAANYAVKGDSTIVTFNKAYIDGLSVGKHTIRFTYTDGYAETLLTIMKADAQPEEPYEPKESGCRHEYEWVFERDATTTENAQEVYQCRYCGRIAVRMDVPNSAYAKFNKDAVKAIDKAPVNGTVTISTPLWVSFHKSVIETLKNRQDVTVVLEYRFKGERYKLTIPAGADLDALEESEGYYGFRYLDMVFAGQKVS